MVKHIKKLVCAALLLSASLSPLAAGVAPEIQDRLTQKLQVLLPDARIDSITETPIEGLYELVVGASITYMSVDGRYAFNGSLIDIDELRNLTNERRESARASSLAALGKQDYIEFSPKGKMQRALYVFTDIDCGYCRKLHQEVPKLNAAGIAVRYLAFPRSGIGGDSFKKLVSVWCSGNRNRAMTISKSGQEVTSPTCDNPVANHFKLGEDFGIRGTPAIYLENGEQIGGYLSAEDVIAEYLPNSL
ncbi:MAG: DsbC family protein [Gammaproteobacteria bacterium]